MKVKKLFQKIEYFCSTTEEQRIWYSKHNTRTGNYISVRYETELEEIIMESEEDGTTAKFNFNFLSKYRSDSLISYEELPQAMKDYFDES